MTQKTPRPVIVKFTDWGDFIQMNKHQWKRVERFLGRTGVFVKEVSRSAVRPNNRVNPDKGNARRRGKL